MTPEGSLTYAQRIATPACNGGACITYLKFIANLLTDVNTASGLRRNTMSWKTFKLTLVDSNFPSFSSASLEKCRENIFYSPSLL